VYKTERLCRPCGVERSERHFATVLCKAEREHFSFKVLIRQRFDNVPAFPPQSHNSIRVLLLEKTRFLRMTPHESTPGLSPV
jgi:hypothetical protein